MDPLSILHHFLTWIAPTGGSAAIWVVIAILPFLVSWAAFRAAEWVTGGEFFHVPLIYGLTALAGIASGLALMHVREETGHESTLASILRIGGRWDLSARDFLVELANPFGYDPVRVIDEFLTPGGGDALNIIVYVALAGALTAAVLALLMYRPLGAALRAWIALVIVALWAAALTIYLVSLAYWSVAKLNFWIFAILLMTLQYYRAHPHRT